MESNTDRAASPHTSASHDTGANDSAEKAWGEHSAKLAEWVECHLLLRRDIHGQYMDNGAQFTAKTTLTQDKLERHFRAAKSSHIIGLHTTCAEQIVGPDGTAIVSCTSKWCTNDIDHHGAGDAPAINWAGALHWHNRAISLGFHPLLVDSNGAGGYRNFIIFADPVRTELAYHFIRWLQKDWNDLGFEQEPECFPKQTAIRVADDPGDARGTCGNWVRLFGRHHKRQHYTRFWDGSEWLVGDEAIDYLLEHTGDDPSLIPVEVHELVKTDRENHKARSRGANTEEKTFADFSLASEALRYIPNDSLHFDDWLKIGMSLKVLGDDGFPLWRRWSESCPEKHVAGECEKRWPTFKSAAELNGDGVNLGTLFDMAMRRGWRFPSEAEEPPTNSGFRGSGSSDTAPADFPLVNDKGIWKSCQHNSRLWLEKSELVGKIRYDQFRRIILLDGEPLSDERVISLNDKIEADTRTPWKQEQVRSALIDIGHKNQFNSLTEWLDSLKWDGIDRIDKFFPDHYESEDTIYSHECARVFFLSAVARAYQPGCQADVMVVMIGNQGTGKSMGFATLCENPDWFADDLGADLCAAKAGEGLQAKWIFEFSEFARINRSTLDDVKSFISRRVDRYRPPWGRHSKDFPRSCVFIGTTNNRQPLHDIENRRFMPIRVGQGDRDAIASTRCLLWAEAVHRYKAGEKWWPTSSQVLQECSSQQENARLNDAWEDILRSKLAGVDKITTIRAAELLGLWDDRTNQTVNRLGRSEQIRVGNALAAIGFDRKRETTGAREWYYERI